MMHNRCSSSHNMVGPCSCGLFHSQSNSSLSMLFSSVHKPASAAAADDENYDPYSYSNAYAYPYAYSPAAASVDCTLSLGTPSTRMSEDSAGDGDGRRGRGGGNGGGHERRSSISNFCWDILGQSKHAPSSQSHKGSARGGGSNSSSGSGSSSCSGDPLLARRCANCDTTSTPLWRNGPRGPKSLCNACGIRFKKEERRATAAAAATANTGSSGGMESSQQLYSHHSHYSSWGAAPAAAQQKVPCYGSEVRLIDDDGRDSDNGISFLSWRLNVTDRPSGLVHDFTR